jgi:dTDP-4-dehydrorhamnose reductase
LPATARAVVSFGPILVVGGDGLIGRALVARLCSLGYDVIATSRRDSVGDLQLDLADPRSWPVLPRAAAAIVVAAVARLGDCERRPELSHSINAVAPALLARRFAEQGTHCLLLSTDKVFDGTVPLRSRGDPLCPTTEYGRQKAAAERAVLAAGGTVLRLAKVLAPDLELLQDWRRQLMSGQPVAPFHDMWLAPIGVGMVTTLIAQLVVDRHSGIFHCAGADDRPYAALATQLADAIGADASLVQPITAEGIIPASQRVRYSSLEMTREKALYGARNPAFDEVVAGVAAGEPV